MRVREHIPLAGLTTLAVGGPARYLLEADNPEEVMAAQSFATERVLPLLILGCVSDLRVSDAGPSGVVLRLTDASLSFRP